MARRTSACAWDKVKDSKLKDHKDPFDGLFGRDVKVETAVRKWIIGL